MNQVEEIYHSLPVEYWIMVVVVLGFFLILMMLADKNNKLKGGKYRIPDGPLGDAKFATEKELDKQYKTIDFDPEKWRVDENSRPTEPGYLLGNWHVGGKVVNRRGIPKYIDKNGKYTGGKVKARVFTDDQHAMLVASSGAGKSAFFLYPSIEYALACGQSIVVTDTKGDNVDRYAPIARQYGYNVLNFHLGKPLQACRWNIMQMTNKYVDKYNACLDKTSEEAINYKAKAETYAKICADTIIKQGTSGDFGANAYFYDSAAGLLTAVILLVAEYADPKERHIVSVYKLIQEMSGTTTKETGEKITKIQEVLDMLPEDSKIRMFAGASAQAGGDSQASVVSTAMSRLLTFLDSEIETMICGDSDIDVERFASHKTIIFITLPEDKVTRHFMCSLLIQSLYRELLQVASDNGNHIPAPEGFKGDKPRITFMLDEAGTLPAISELNAILSAARSRGIFLILILQGTSQLDKNYGKETAKIIMDNCKLVYFTGISSVSEDAEKFSKLLGKYTVQTNSVSNSTNGHAATRNKSRSLQMTAVDLMSPEEIRHQIKQGDFIIMRTSEDPLRAHFDLYLDWGITLKEKETFEARSAKEIYYTNLEKIKRVLSGLIGKRKIEPQEIDMAAAQAEMESIKKKEADDQDAFILAQAANADNEPADDNNVGEALTKITETKEVINPIVSVEETKNDPTNSEQTYGTDAYDEYDDSDDKLYD